MVFDLEVETADKPGNEFIPRREIGGGFYLMYRPFIFNFLWFDSGCKNKFRIFHHVGELKNKCQRKAHRNMHTGKADAPGAPSDKMNRDQDIEYYIHDLASPENKMFFQIHFLQAGIVNLSFEIFVEIHHRYPCKRGDGINQHHVKMLEAVRFNPFLGRALTHDRAFGDIIVDPINVCISMMNDIVFELPDESVSAEQVQAESHQGIYPGSF